MRTKLLSLVAAISAMAVACVTVGGTAGIALTPEHIAAYGRRTFDAPMDKVFEASVAALKAQGYEVVHQDPAKGLIKTGQKLIRTHTHEEHYEVGILEEKRTASTTIDITRRYALTVSAVGEQVSVEAVPTVFRGQQDISGQAVWDLDSPQGEHALWNQLFDEIASML